MRALYYVFIALIIAGLIFLQTTIAGLPFAEATLDKLTPFQEKQIDLFKELNGLLITLAVAVIGGVGAFVLDQEKIGRLSGWQKARAIATMSLAGISIVSGYLSHETVLWMLRHDFFNAKLDRLMWSDGVQFWSFAAAVLILADFFYGALRSRPQVGDARRPLVVVMTAVLTFLICVPRASAQTREDKSITVYENLHIAAEVSTVITRWQEASRVQIEEAAQRAIVEGFGQSKKVLAQAYAKTDLTPQRASELTDALIEHYLYDLRDRKIATAKRNAAVPTAHFLAPQAESSVMSIVITLSDVELYPPKVFIEKIRPVLDKPVGYIKVLSDPDLAHVAIDGKPKDELTCRKFVASLGTHTVDVTKPSTNVKCSEKVTVEAGEDQLVPCPKGTIMRCKVP